MGFITIDALYPTLKKNNYIKAKMPKYGYLLNPGSSRFAYGHLLFIHERVISFTMSY